VDVCPGDDVLDVQLARTRPDGPVIVAVMVPVGPFTAAYAPTVNLDPATLNGHDADGPVKLTVQPLEAAAGAMIIATMATIPMSNPATADRRFMRTPPC